MAPSVTWNEAHERVSERGGQWSAIKSSIRNEPE